MLDAFVDAGLDSLRMLPFLFVTYLFMEYLEQHASGRIAEKVKGSGRLGPVIGGIAGIFPQCGFSTAASNLYAGKVITAGTLLAIFLSTSDEMLPLFISSNLQGDRILKILLLKAAVGISYGLLFDLLRRNVFKKQEEPMDIHSLCEREGCHCDDTKQEFKDARELHDLKSHKEHHGGIVRPAIKHTLSIFFFILVSSVIINVLVETLGEDAIRSFFGRSGLMVDFAAALIGLIPNCAASVFITEFFLEGMIGFGAMMSGLLTGAGIGLLVLFRVNNDLKKNLCLTAILYFCGVLSGIVIDILNISL